MTLSLPARGRRVVVAAATLLALAAAGCARSEPGVVAYVGDEKISQAQLDQAVAGLSTTLQAGQTVSTEAVVNALIQGEVAEHIAAERRITITDADRDAALQGSELAPLLTVPDAKPIAYDVADYQLVSSKLGAEAYLAALKQQRVTLNPRYGVLDPEQKTVVTGQSGSLSEPAGGATPAP